MKENKNLMRYRYGMLAFVAAVLITGCDELPFEKRLSTREFLIKAGEHYSTPRLAETITDGRLAFRATFDESAVYDLKDPANQGNKNKLMGFSDCGSLHHDNSARFAWAWINNRLEIYAYCYVDSMRVEEFIGTVGVNEENLYEITKTATEYIFYINGDQKTSIVRSSTCSEGTNYMLYPYFGGSVPAPHDVRINIEMVD